MVDKRIIMSSLLGLVIISPAYVLAADQIGGGDQAQSQPPGPYSGRSFMTPQEHFEFRNKMQNAKTSEEKAKIRQEHHAQMQERAKEHGMTMPDMPPDVRQHMGMQPGMGPGMRQGMGPGMQQGMGQGMGPGMQQGMGPGMRQGMGPGMQQGMGQGMGPGYGQGMGPGYGQGMGPGYGQGMGPGYGQGMGPGYDQGMGPGYGPQYGY